jgi:thiamine biosynthesis lipoprotein
MSGASAMGQPGPEASEDSNVNGESTPLSSHHFIHRAMGTEFRFQVYLREGDVGRDDLALVVREAFDAIDVLEQQISSWIASSDTSSVNKHASDGSVRVRRDVFDLFLFSRLVYDETLGAFDVTVGPLVDVLRAADSEGGDLVTDALSRVGMHNLVLDLEEQTISFKKSGMRVDFGGIGKGLALDAAAEVLRNHGVESALLVGGDSSILAIGSPRNKQYWEIGIDNPYNEERNFGMVYLRDEALSTSACRVTMNPIGGAVRHECDVFDPRTGALIDGMTSVTVVAPTGVLTDALSTAFFVMGTEGAREYCRKRPEVRAVLVERDSENSPAPVYIGGFGKQHTRKQHHAE